MKMQMSLVEIDFEVLQDFCKFNDGQIYGSIKINACEYHQTIGACTESKCPMLKIEQEKVKNEVESNI